MQEEGRGLTHLDERGQARMVDVSEKPATHRRAVARGRVEMSAAALEAIRTGAVAKGDVLAVARVAGIMAAKQTGQWIPLCHPLPLSSVAVDFHLDEAGPAVEIQARAEAVAPTGVEMEALAAATGAALAIYDMAKALDKAMTITGVRLIAKEGGRSGVYRRPGEDPWPGAGEGRPR